MTETKPVPHEEAGGGTSKVTATWGKPVLCPSLSLHLQTHHPRPQRESKVRVETYIGFPENIPGPQEPGLEYQCGRLPCSLAVFRKKIKGGRGEWEGQTGTG